MLLFVHLTCKRSEVVQDFLGGNESEHLDTYYHYVCNIK